MFIKSTSREAGNIKIPFDWKKALLGTDDADNYRMVALATFGFWGISVVVAIGLFVLNDGGVIWDYIFKTLGVSAGIGFGMAIISLIGRSDWNRQYGQAMWNRVVGYNVVVFLLAMSIQNNIGMTPITEPVKSVQFVKTDIKNCTYSIKLESQNMKYTYCESLGLSYDRTRDDISKMQVNLVGYHKYGDFIASNVEFVEKTLELK